MHSALLLNTIGGALIILAFLAVCGWSVLSADSELVETAELTAKRWAIATVTDSDALDHLIRHDEVTPADRTYLETIARTADILSFAIYDAAGHAVFSYAPDRSLTLPSELPADAQSEVEILHGDDTAGAPQVMARISFPLASVGEGAGSVSVLTDQTAATALYRGEMYVTLAVTSILAAIGLGNSLGVFILLRRKQTTDDRIFMLAHQDALTGLANRKQFQDGVGRHFPIERSTDPQLALHFVDLDGFKSVNDTFGHPAGDKLLKVVAGQLLRCVRAEDMVARLGGDEFAVLQVGIKSEGEAEALAERLVESVRAIRKTDGNAVGVSLSVGTALAPDHARNADDLTKFADIALYRAKDDGRDRHVMFVLGMEEEVNARNSMRITVRQAVEANTIELYYQPIYRSADNTIVSFEALARLSDPLGEGMLAPSDFIPVAESMGLMPQLGTLVLNEACRTAATWPDAISVSVNLSAQQFNEDVVATVAAALAASGLSPERLELEITESILIENEDAVIAQLNALKELGVSIVMDDFGKGYSSLGYLWRLPFDKLKVDRSFFDSIGKSDSVKEVLRTIIAMSDSLHLTVIAEGIETNDQRSFARNAGYHQMQGFLCGSPMPRGDVLQRIEVDSHRAGGVPTPPPDAA